MRKAKNLNILTLKIQQVLKGILGRVLPLQGELSLLLFILHNLRDGFLLREVWIGCFGFAVLIVCNLFFRGKVTIA